ncbi:DUF2190 family protein [uncultured Paraglaciecola sp.]|uniref:DUF2190 family protein n=1 Tax=uncultured Paraglaciecola sp. TaxID=1765024 RepID=UPI0026315F99|nr:DUF2190 family protein [uncultured Paraglaciecola sp.]
MKNFIQPGNTLDLTPSSDVASGTGFRFGTSLFGVAVNDVSSGQSGAFLVEGVVEIAKTSALAVSVGERLFWNVANSVVNKTSTSQQCVGIAIEDAANPSDTVKMKIGSFNAVGD